MPPLTLESAVALVPGGVTRAEIDKENKAMQAQAKSAPSANVQFAVERAFYYQGKVCEAGKMITLPRVFGLEMQAARKGKIVAEEQPAPAAVTGDKPVDAKKGDRNAR